MIYKAVFFLHYAKEMPFTVLLRIIFIIEILAQKQGLYFLVIFSKTGNLREIPPYPYLNPKLYKGDLLNYWQLTSKIISGESQTSTFKTLGISYSSAFWLKVCFLIDWLIYSKSSSLNPEPTLEIG